MLWNRISKTLQQLILIINLGLLLSQGWMSQPAIAFGGSLDLKTSPLASTG
jgi:hypothetical protein